MLKYSRATGNCYLVGIHAVIPDDAVDITEERFLATVGNPQEGKRIGHDADGLPILIDESPPIPKAQQLFTAIDSAANNAHEFVVGGTLRALEYELTAEQAQAYVEAGCPEDNVPPMVAAWAVNGRAPKQAADEILAKHAQYVEVVSRLRTVRLAGKEQVRTLMSAGELTEAKKVVADTLAAIEEVSAGADDNQELL